MQNKKGDDRVLYTRARTTGGSAKHEPAGRGRGRPAEAVVSGRPRRAGMLRAGGWSAAAPCGRLSGGRHALRVLYSSYFSFQRMGTASGSGGPAHARVQPDDRLQKLEVDDCTGESTATKDIATRNKILTSDDSLIFSLG